MIKNEKVTAIILVAGNSTRYGKNKNKNFEVINEKTVLSYSLKEFDMNSYIDNIIIAVKETEIEEVENIVKKENLTKKVTLIIGGNSRKESVYNCITSTDADIVIIHDGARPLIQQEYINKCIENTEEFEGVTIGVKSKDTIKITDANDIVINTTNRSNTWIIQTPQCFNRKTLLKAHQRYTKEDATDDCALLEKDNHKIKIIEGDYTNIKVTTFGDLNIIKEFISATNIKDCGVKRNNF